MAPPKKKRTPAQVRDRRAKIAAVVLGVVFLGVAAIQGPKLLKELHPATPRRSRPAPPPTPDAGSTSFAAATLDPGQLRRFSTFARKDPFKALAKLGGSAAAAGGTSGSAAPAAPAAKPSQKLAVVPPVGASGRSATFTETPVARPRLRPGRCRRR